MKMYNKKRKVKNFPKITLPGMNFRDAECIYAFVDGSFNHTTGVYGYGGFLCVGNKRYVVMGNGKDTPMAKSQNVAGEIAGAMAIVKKAEDLKLKRMVLFYDYEGIKGWAIEGWARRNITSRTYYEFMNSEEHKVDIFFQKVKGHNGIEGNEIADIIAKVAAGNPLNRVQSETFQNLQFTLNS